MSEFVPINLSDYLTNKGITSENEMSLGELSIGGSSLPYLHFNFDSLFHINSIPFIIYQKDDKDNMELNQQMIPLQNIEINKIHMLGVTNNGNFSERAYLIKNGEHVLKTTISFSDFLSPTPFYNEKLAFEFPYMHSRNGLISHYKPKIWMNTFSFDHISADHLFFEENMFIHIFAITIEGNINRTTIK